MGSICEDVVLIEEAKREGEHTVITVNCPDKPGIHCDLCRILLLFGLSIAKGDLLTDGTWCYLIFWVVGKPKTRWDLLKTRIREACPTCIPSAAAMYYFKPEFQPPNPQQLFLLKFWCSDDRKGLLHDVTEALYELELTIKRVKVYTAPDGRVMDLFFITDTRELLNTSERQEETINRLKFILGDGLVKCDIEPAVPEVALCLRSVLPSSVVERFINLQMHGEESCSGLLSSDCVKIVFDNTLSPSHTLLHIFCQDHKGLIYDIMRTLKDFNVQVSYGRFHAKSNGNCEMDLFLRQADGKKITDTHKRNTLRFRLRMELIHPLRLDIISRGPDTEVLVVNPVELSGRGRPLVFYDITLALKILNITIFLVEICRHRVNGREWEVYRILLDEWDCLSATRDEIKECVRKKLMGWD